MLLCGSLQLFVVSFKTISNREENTLKPEMREKNKNSCSETGFLFFFFFWLQQLLKTFFCHTPVIIVVFSVFLSGIDLKNTITYISLLEIDKKE